MATDTVHPDPTRRSRFRYLFYGKHHGGGSSTDAEWSKDVSRAEEFSVFDEADFRDVSDERGSLYGVLRGVDGLRDLGTWQQQIAKFPLANEGVPWHGYPIWAVNQDGPANRASQKMLPDKGVFEKMEQAGLITRRERKRLYKGQHAGDHA